MPLLNNPRYGQCRDIAHRWGIEPILEVVGPSIIRRAMVCDHCGTIRKDTLMRSGVLVDRSYSRPKDYRVEGRHSKVEFRKEFLGDLLSTLKTRDMSDMKNRARLREKARRAK